MIVKCVNDEDFRSFAVKIWRIVFEYLELVTLVQNL